MAAKKGLKIIINGEAHYMPDTKQTRSFYDDRNRQLGKNIKGNKRSRVYDKEFATIMEATPEEVEKYIFPTPKARTEPIRYAQALAQAPASQEIEVVKAENAEIKRQLEELKELIKASQNKPAEDADDSDFQSFDDGDDDSTVVEKPKKPGRPAKNK